MVPGGTACTVSTQKLIHGPSGVAAPKPFGLCHFLFAEPEAPSGEITLKTAAGLNQILELRGNAACGCAPQNRVVAQQDFGVQKMKGTIQDEYKVDEHDEHISISPYFQNFIIRDQ